MNDGKLVSALNATGKECFVSYLKHFSDSHLTNEEIASIIQRERGYTFNSCRSRTSKARSILKNNRLKDALQIIIEADRTDYQCRIKAQELLNEIEPQKIKIITRNRPAGISALSTTVHSNNKTSSLSTTSGFKPNFNHRRIAKISNIKFPDLSNTVERELTFILGKICHHIHPEIVNYIAKNNLTYQTEFESICHKSCNINSFFYENSDCVFPGFRRPINKEKTGKWKNNVFENDGTILNDNTFPRHIWAHLSENKAYSGGAGGMWSSSGLAKFELAHIFGHKQDERGLEEKVFKLFTEKTEPYGLFTSASNIVLIPKGFAKPTDHMKSIKICFYKRHLDLYGNNIIGLSNFDESLVPSWYSEIKWLEPILPDDWKNRIETLLNYRKKYLQKKYSDHAKISG
jgi:hypothetical protein